MRTTTLHQAVRFGAAVGRLWAFCVSLARPDVRFLLRARPAPQFAVRPKPIWTGWHPRSRRCSPARGESRIPLIAAASGCPRPSDVDNDGVSRIQDLCPREPRDFYPDPKGQSAGPLGIKIATASYRRPLPKQPPGDKPRSQSQGCPLPDRDNDGVVDKKIPVPRKRLATSPIPSGLAVPPQPKDPAVDESFARPATDLLRGAAGSIVATRRGCKPRRTAA